MFLREILYHCGLFVQKNVDSEAEGPKPFFLCVVYYCRGAVIFCCNRYVLLREIDLCSKVGCFKW